jgi:hypothetical protein
MTVSDKQLVTTAAWPAGIDNLSPENDLTRDDKGKAVIAFRVGENVDLDKDGKARLREGRRQVLAGGLVHSLWRDGFWPFAMAVVDGVLTALYAGGQSFPILTGVTRYLPISYALVGERVFWSNGSDSGVVNIDGSPAPWGCPTPYGNPTLTESVGVGGLISLDKSRYQIALTWVLGTGEESGALIGGVIAIDEGSGITLSDIPAPEDPNVRAVRVYISPADGDVFYHATDLTPGVPVALIGIGRRGKLLETQFLDRMPPGQIVRLLNGRLFVADGNTLCWSEALRYGLTDPVNNRLVLGGGDISMLEPVASGSDTPGLFIAAGKRVYWLGGNDPGVFNQVIVRPYGVVPGTSIKVPASVFGLEESTEVIYWMGTDGVACLGMPNGQVMPLKESQVVAPISQSGASMFRERNGIRQVVTAMQQAAPRGMAVGDSAVITVSRYDGTTLPTPPGL